MQGFEPGFTSHGELKLGFDYLDLEMSTARRELVVSATRSPRCACPVVILSDAVPIKRVERLISEQSICRTPAKVRLSTKFPNSQRQGSGMDERHEALAGIGAIFFTYSVGYSRSCLVHARCGIGCRQ